MRILFSGEDFYPPKSGGDFSVLTLFEELAKKHRLEAVCIGDEARLIKHKGIDIYIVKSHFSKIPSWGRRYFLNKKWMSVLDGHLKKKKYDFLITQSVLAPSSYEIAKKYNIPTLIFIRSYEHFCLSHLKDIEIPKKHNCFKRASWKYKIQYPFFSKLVKWHETALRGADFLAANSNFMASITKEWYGIEPDTIYPFIKLENYKTRDMHPEYVTLVRPHIRKGVEVFLKITDSLPEVKFLAVGGGEKISELKKRKNIKYIPWIDDMKKVYSKTKILLVPSTWFEPFGRIVIEAMCNGIPCIVSNKGGLPEAVGDAGIVANPFETDVWVEVINKLNSDNNFYLKLSKKSRRHAEKFDFKYQYKKFRKLTEIL